MRFKLILKVNKEAFGDLLPINYQYEQSAAIYKILSSADKEFSCWLHDNGFQDQYGKKRFKLFTYSPFKIRKRIVIAKESRIKIVSDQVEWQISFLPERSTKNFVQGIFSNRVFEIGDRKTSVQFIVKSVEVLPEPQYEEEMEFYTMSGICIKLNEHDGRVRYLSPDDKEFRKGVFDGMLSKYEAFFGYPFVGSNDFEFKLLNPSKAKLITLKARTRQETKVKCYLFSFKMKAPKEFMKIIYEGVLGELCSQGFGCLGVNL